MSCSASPAPCGQSNASRKSLAKSASFVASASVAAPASQSFAAPAPSFAAPASQSFVASASAVAPQASSLVVAAPTQSFARSASYSSVSRQASQRAASQRSAAAAAPAANFSQLEQQLLSAQSPLPTQETARTSANGVSGIFLNKSEVDQWRGSKPLSSYQFNQDSNPQVIKKQSKPVEHVQQVNVRFLKPPSGQAGPIIIKQQPNKQAEPAPPVIIRQQGCGAKTPAPQVFREAPPQTTNIGCKVITLKGKCLPPPPRRVIIEKLPSQPAKPGKICVDRWLAPEGLKRKVIFKPAPGAQQEAPKNVVIEWSPVQANVRQEVNVRGVVDQDPNAYSQQHGSKLVQASQLPDAARNVQAPNGARLAADAAAQPVELEGDVHALALVDLDAEGLSEYKSLVAQFPAASNNGSNASVRAASRAASGCGGCPATPAPAAPTPAPSCGGCPPTPAPSCGC